MKLHGRSPRYLLSTASQQKLFVDARQEKLGSRKTIYPRVKPMVFCFSDKILDHVFRSDIRR